MARRWDPPSEVKDSEPVGRRIFSDSVFEGKLDQGQPGRLRVDHFLEKREGVALSVDRLGRSNEEIKVIAYLRSRCRRAAGNFQPPRPFRGWAKIRVKEIRGCREIKFRVCGSPDVEEERDDLYNNKYHADIKIPDLGREAKQFIDMRLVAAIILRELCERSGSVLLDEVGEAPAR